MTHCMQCFQDDPFGAPFPLCESDFSGPDSRDSLVRWLAETQFDAIIYCPDCKVASPPPPPIEAHAQTPSTAVVGLFSESMTCSIKLYLILDLALYVCTVQAAERPRLRHLLLRQHLKPQAQQCLGFSWPTSLMRHVRAGHSAFI